MTRKSKIIKGEGGWGSVGRIGQMPQNFAKLAKFIQIWSHWKTKKSERDRTRAMTGYRWEIDEKIELDEEASTTRKVIALVDVIKNFFGRNLEDLDFLLSKNGPF